MGNDTGGMRPALTAVVATIAVLARAVYWVTAYAAVSGTRIRIEADFLYSRGAAFEARGCPAGL